MSVSLGNSVDNWDNEFPHELGDERIDRQIDNEWMNITVKNLNK